MLSNIKQQCNSRAASKSVRGFSFDGDTSGKNCVTKCRVVCFSPNINQVIKSRMMKGWTCGTLGKEGKYVQSFGKEIRREETTWKT